MIIYWIVVMRLVYYYLGISFVCMNANRMANAIILYRGV